MEHKGEKLVILLSGFDHKQLGGIVNASRSLMCAYKAERWKEQYTEEEYAKATRQEALRMKEELNQAIDG